VGSLARQPGTGSCPYCGRRIGPRFTLGLFSRGSSRARSPFATRHLPHLSSAVGRLGEDIRYLAGIVGWPAAIWKVTRTAALNTLIVLVCVVVVALPQTHLVARAVTGAILAAQVGWLLFLLWQVRRDATQSRLTHRLASGVRNGIPARTDRPGPLTASPRAVNLGQALVGGQAGQLDPVDRDQSPRAPRPARPGPGPGHLEPPGGRPFLAALRAVQGWEAAPNPGPAPPPPDGRTLPGA
jgi:hypothetical protein